VQFFHQNTSLDFHHFRRPENIEDNFPIRTLIIIEKVID
jgi:hypothetical protein